MHLVVLPACVAAIFASAVDSFTAWIPAVVALSAAGISILQHRRAVRREPLDMAAVAANIETQTVARMESVLHAYEAQLQLERDARTALIASFAAERTALLKDITIRDVRIGELERKVDTLEQELRELGARVGGRRTADPKPTP